MLGSNIFLIVFIFLAAAAALYALYSIILFNGGFKKGDDYQLTTNILEQIDILFEKKEYELVELLATKYLARAPKHIKVRRYLAKAYFENKKYKQAIEQCGIILKIDPNDAEIRSIIDQCY